MTKFNRALAATLLLAAATPVLAQTAPPPPPAGSSATAPRGYVRDRPGGMHHRGMFNTLSPAGQATMREAMKGDEAARKAERDGVKAARDRMLTLLDAEKLDVAAVKRAMADERNAANASRERMQASMLAGFQKLSLADRRAFVAEAKALKSRMEGRMKDWRDRKGEDMPPPEPPLF
jgi:uncharacterized membrane protein